MAEASPSRFRLPRLGWLLLAAVLLGVAAVTVSVGVPYYKQQQAIAEIEAVGGTVMPYRRTGPVWLREVLRNRFMRGFDRGWRVAFPASATSQQVESLEGLRSVKTLWLLSASITDAGLAYLAKETPGVEVLVLSNTKVSDQGVSHLKELTTLWSLSLAETRITDEALTTLKDINSLVSLFVGKTCITDTGLRHIGQMTNLRDLSLQETRITDAGLRHLASLKDLRHLYLGGTGITNNGLRHLSGLTELEELHLFGTRIDDAGLRHLKRLTDLESLHLEDTQVTEKGIAELRKALPRCSIHYD